MFRIRGLTVAGLMLGLSVLVACGGGETGQQEAASSGMAAAGAAEAEEGQEAQKGQEAQEGGAAKLPEGVTQEMVEQGKEVYAGAGVCLACHGPNGKGIPGLGADLSDEEWAHSDGSFEGIVETIMSGVDASKATTGTAMPPKGGGGITDEQVKAVAAYVYTLSKGEKEEE